MHRAPTVVVLYGTKEKDSWSLENGDLDWLTKMIGEHQTTPTEDMYSLEIIIAGSPTFVSKSIIDVFSRVEKYNLASKRVPPCDFSHSTIPFEYYESGNVLVRSLVEPMKMTSTGKPDVKGTTAKLRSLIVDIKPTIFCSLGARTRPDSHIETMIRRGTIVKHADDFKLEADFEVEKPNIHKEIKWGIAQEKLGRR
jgi:hypothetical protein